MQDNLLTKVEPPQPCHNCELTDLNTLESHQVYELESGYAIGDCCRRFFHVCRGCDALYHRAGMVMATDTERFFCEGCTDELMWDDETELYYQYDLPNNRDIIHDYSYRP